MSEEKRKINMGAVVILIISAVVFIPFGGSAVFDAFFNSNKVSFGKINGKEIVYEPGSELFNAAANLSKQYEKDYGWDTNDNRIHRRILSNAYFEAIRSRIYSDAVADSGYEVPEEAVDKALVKYFSPEGKFLKAAYEQQSEGEIKSLRENFEKQLTFTRYSDDLFASEGNLYGVKSSAKEIDFIASLAQEKHSFETAAFDTSVCPDEVAVSYLKDKADDFTKYSLLAVTMDKKKDAEEVLQSVKNGDMEFDTAVTEKSQKYYTGDDGSLNSSYEYQINAMFEESADAESVKALAVDGISDVLVTKLGYTFFKCTAAPVKADLKSEETAKVVKDYIKNNESSLIEKHYLAKADEFVSEASVHGFDAACKKFSIEKTEIPAFAINYRSSSLINSTASTAPLSSIGRDKDLLEKVFSLKVKEVSTPFVTGNNVVVAICTGIQNDEANTVGLDAKVSNTDYYTATSAVSSYVDDEAFAKGYAKAFPNRNQD
ncbi:SurA N-terminal domain-containing protein [Treponema sp.]|uniref:SurA N-terminal domain-containing protein n=1 Tax=Treponema sp. TaxID=166 RepID=UPI0025DB390D|nr:SurA N-terminal domain-containing protein [Treponema sp.]MCR5218285.1 SurA N-terminal domain-containing protein [Treponema sp.]